MKIIGFLIKINIYRFVIAGEYMALFKVEICGVNTSKLPLLTEDEKKELNKERK